MQKHPGTLNFESLTIRIILDSINKIGWGYQTEYQDGWILVLTCIDRPNYQTHVKIHTVSTAPATIYSNANLIPIGNIVLIL